MTKTLLAAAGLASIGGLALAASASESVAVEALIKIQHDRVDRVPGEPSAFFELPRKQAEDMESQGILRILDVVDTSQLQTLGVVEQAGSALSADAAVVDTSTLTTFADVGDLVKLDQVTAALQAEQAKSAELGLALAAAQAKLADTTQQLEAAQATFVLGTGPADVAVAELGTVVGDVAAGGTATDAGAYMAEGDVAMFVAPTGDAQADAAEGTDTANTAAAEATDTPATKGKGAKATKA
jgi:hypothetical protein